MLDARLPEDKSCKWDALWWICHSFVPAYFDASCYNAWTVTSHNSNTCYCLSLMEYAFMMTIAGQPFFDRFSDQQLITQFQQKTELNVTQISTQQVFVLSRKTEGDDHKKYSTCLTFVRVSRLKRHKTISVKSSSVRALVRSPCWASKGDRYL